MNNFTNWPEGASSFNSYMPSNAVLQAPGLQIHGGSASPLAQAANAFDVRNGAILGVQVAATTDMPSLATAVNSASVAVGNLLSNMCRIYTFLASVNPTTGVVTLSVVAGNDFTKSRPANVYTDVYIGDGSKSVIGYLYVKNEIAASAPFIPNTTNLDASGVTSHFNDQFGYSIQLPFTKSHLD